MTKILIVLVTIFLLSFRPVSAQTSTEAANTIREKVQEKIDSALKSPRAYIGTVTDKAEATIEIRNLEGEIQQIAVKASETAFVKVDKQNKDVKFADVAIGDFLIAMGYKNGNSVLDGQRILLTEAFKPTTRKTVLVTIGKVDTKKKLVEVKEVKSDKDFVVKTEVSLTALKEGQKALVVGSISGNIIEARFIQLTENIPTTLPTPKPSPSTSPSPTPKP